MIYDYGLLFKRAINDQVVGLISFDDQGLYCVTECQKLWRSEDRKLFHSLLKDLAHPELLAKKYNINIPHNAIPDLDLKKEIMNIAKLVNSHGFSVSGYELLAYPVTIDKTLQTKNFPYYEKKYKYNMEWVYAFMADKRFESKRFKTLSSKYSQTYSCPENMIDVVSHEEYIKNDDRIPIFKGTMCGLFPPMDKLEGFFNGDKYIAVISKSLLSGAVMGMTIYQIPSTTKSISPHSTAGMKEVASYSS